MLKYVLAWHRVLKQGSKGLQVVLSLLKQHMFALHAVEVCTAVLKFVAAAVPAGC
jgi:hypothetical protein